MPIPWPLQKCKYGLVMLTGNMPNGRVTLVTRVNERVMIVTPVT